MNKKLFPLPNDPLFPLQWHLHNNGSVPGSVAGFDINVLPVWPDYTGRGVLVAVFDDGMDETHPDLAANYERSLAWNVEENRPGAQATGKEFHGVPVAGLILASAGNGIGGVGVAWDARLTFYASPSFDNWERAADKALEQGVDVFNNSWGPKVVFVPRQFMDQDLFLGRSRQLVEQGRDGLGTVTLFAAGNARDIAHDANAYATTASPWVITVAAGAETGNLAYYSNPGANVLITAPGSDPQSIITTDRQSTDGRNRLPGEAGNYTDLPGSEFNGTSAATPIASGVVALVLDANHGLGYRDVQEILAYSARRATFLDREVIPMEDGPDFPLDKHYNGAHDWNGGAHLVSHDFGYGHIDAHAAVRLAESWMKTSTYSNLVIEEGQAGQREVVVDAGGQAALTATFSAPYRIEHMTVTIDLETDNLSAVTLELISPEGTVSRLINRPQPQWVEEEGEEPQLYELPEEVTHLFDTVQSWGENLAGVWTLRLTNDASGGTVHLKDWSIAAYTAGAVDPVSSQQIFTDEFARFAQEQASRKTLDAGNGAILNAAAVTQNVVFDLGGGASRIGDTTIQLGDPAAFRHLISGDGDDILIGNAGDNLLMPGRGGNYVDGGAGLDVLRLIGDSTGYHIEQHDGTLFVFSNALSDGGVDHVRNVELLLFSDQVRLTHAPRIMGEPAFDEAAYLLQNPDVADAVAAGVFDSGWQHYQQWGSHEGRNPNALFSETWYLEHNPDVAGAVAQGAIVNGFAHYREWGWQEGRAPSAWMDPHAYLEAYTDVAAAGLDPLQHYLLYGFDEGRSIKSVDAALWV